MPLQDSSREATDPPGNFFIFVFFVKDETMVVGERKPLSEIKEMVGPYKKILVAGCDTCTAECLSGGRKQVAELAAALDMAFRLEGKEKEILEVTVDRQCIHDF